MIEYIHSSAMNSTMLTPMHGTECKGLGKILGIVVGVVAAIAVPFLAPVIGAALGGGIFASIAGQALIGAGIGALGGAAGAAISGGSILQGALIGGAGGALAGGVGAWMSGASLTGAAPSAVSGVDAAGAGFQISQAGGAGTSTGLITGVDAVTGLPLAAAGVAGAAGASLSPALASATPATSTGILGGISTAFKTAAVQTLVQGGTMALQAMMPSQQAEIFKQMQAEMEVTRTQDIEAYNAQKKIFDEYYNFAKGINPTYWAELERANEQQRLSTTWADSERSLREGGASKAEIAGERRRQEVGASAGLNTAYTGGFNRGMQAQGAAYQTASNLYPSTPTGYSENLKNMYDIAGTNEANQAAGIAGLIEPWKVYAQERAQRV